MLVIHAAFPIETKKRSTAIELSQTLAEQSRNEDGVIEYRIAADVEDEGTIRFFERYEDEEAFGAHARTDHFKAFAAELPALLDGEPTVTRFDVSDVSAVEF